ncbi:MAG: TRAP transporter small permease [Planctomycetota bacterium]|jgi:TRAP-type C4-dicarboxylate transport system permease small subunit|nr:TRAP transporter small permease [Planctomycetota bacterium]
MAKKILKLEEWVTVLCFLASLAAILWQIFSRYALNSPSTWTEELSRLLYVYMACLGIHMSQRENLHVRIDILYNLFPAGLKRIADRFISVLLCAAFCYLAYKSVSVVQRKWPIPLVTLGGISSSFLYVNLVVLCSTLALRFAVETVSGLPSPPPAGEGDSE